MVADTEAVGQAYPALQLPLHPVVFRPAVEPYSPGAQSTQTPAPISEYLPLGHTVGVGDTDPAGHAYPPEQGPLQLAVA